MNVTDCPNVDGLLSDTTAVVVGEAVVGDVPAVGLLVPGDAGLDTIVEQELDPNFVDDDFDEEDEPLAGVDLAGVDDVVDRLTAPTAPAPPADAGSVDVPAAPEREVAAHLAACEGCRRLAEEFSESSSLLTQAFTPPEFGAEFYSGIRHAVLGEIASNQMPAKPSLFRPRWLYATAFAAIVIVSGVMLQHFAGTRHEPPRDLARAPQAADQPTPRSSEGPLPGKKHELTGKQNGSSNSLLALANPHGSFRHFAELRKPDALVTQAALVSGAQIEPAMQSSTSLGPVALETSSQVSRIEIQTADPNIRIIWLSSRESREPDGTNHDQDHPETSNRK